MSYSYHNRFQAPKNLSFENAFIYREPFICTFFFCFFSYHTGMLWVNVSFIIKNLMSIADDFSNILFSCLLAASSMRIQSTNSHTRNIKCSLAKNILGLCSLHSFINPFRTTCMITIHLKM